VSVVIQDTLCQAVIDHLHYSVVRLTAWRFKGKFYGVTYKNDRRIELVQSAGRLIFLHEVGHALCGSSIRGRYLEEVSVEIFKFLIITDGDMTKAMKKFWTYWNNGAWDRMMIDWIMHYEEVKKETAKKLLKIRKIDWKKAKMHGRRLWRTEFGQLINRMNKNKAKLGV